MDQMFTELFGETKSERRLVEEVAVSWEEERQIGDTGLQDLFDSLHEQKIRVVNRGNEARYLNSLVGEIHPLMRNAERYRAIRVYVAETKITDARAFPGGAIVCTSGLIDFAWSEAALVGVLAHELSHIDRGHLLRTARGVKLAQDATAVGNGAGPFVRNGILVAKQFARPFRPEDEAEADLDAAEWMFELGYDPKEWRHYFGASISSTRLTKYDCPVSFVHIHITRNAMRLSDNIRYGCKLATQTWTCMLVEQTFKRGSRVTFDNFRIKRSCPGAGSLKKPVRLARGLGRLKNIVALSLKHCGNFGRGNARESDAC
jgi:hypothetical protein